MPVIELITEIKAPQEVCFDLARSIDLHKHSTAHTNEEAVDGVTSGLIGLNEFVTWKAKHFGITQHLTSRITQYDRPHSFTDEMVKGAFRKITHQHLFIRHGDITLMKDHFQFESPYGLLGSLVNLLVLKSYLRSLLVKRNSVIKQIAESGNWKEFL
jgi:ligand-binding SRPBCC domain-containing protein